MNCRDFSFDLTSLRSFSITYVGYVHEQIEDAHADHGEERWPLVVLPWILNFAQNLI